MILQSFTKHVEKDFTSFPLNINQEGQTLQGHIVALNGRHCLRLESTQRKRGQGMKRVEYDLDYPIKPLDPAIPKAIT